MTFSGKPRGQEAEEGPKMYFFIPFFGAPGRNLISITTNTGIEVEHYHTCINPLVILS